jgi:hypothetical protein
MRRSWTALALSSFFIILIAFYFASTFAASSAEIGCAARWYYPQDATPEKNEQILQQRFPSDRRPVPGTTCLLGVLRGTIDQGDDEKLLDFYRANHPFLVKFYLISPGGNVNAAINIGRLFRKYLITVQSPSRDTGNVRVLLFEDTNKYLVDLCKGYYQCTCASACALVWFGAVERWGEVGLHRPTTDDPAFKALSTADASTSYRRVLGSMTAYLSEMEVPRAMIDALVGTPSSEMRWVDSDDLLRPPSIAEWEDASCGSLTSEERNAFYALGGKSNLS